MNGKRWVITKNGDLEPHKGWFSARHETRDAHDAAREAYLAERGPEARRRKAAARVS